MSWKREGDTVTVSMSVQDWEWLLFLFGHAAGRLKPDDQEMFWKAIALVNRLNEGNPEFTPYEIPEGVKV